MCEISNNCSTISASFERIRLQGPTSQNGAGRVEVYYKEQWGTIIDNGWNLQNAKVVCRQLGYKNGVPLQANDVPNGDGKMWLRYVSCTGNEQSLASCYSGKCGEYRNCGHDRDVGVKCSSTGKFLYCFWYTHTKLSKMDLILRLCNSYARRDYIHILVYSPTNFF